MEQPTLVRECANGKQKQKEETDQSEAEAAIKIWDYVFGFTEMAVIRCVIELGIADLLEKNGGSMSLSKLSSTIKCLAPTLHRIMRFSTHRKIFIQKKTSENNLIYTQTPISSRLVKHGKNSMDSLILLQSSPVMLSTWLKLSKRVQEKNITTFGDREDMWSYGAVNPSYGKLFNNAMACDASLVVSQILKEYPYIFDGVTTVVDVGGGNGAALSMFIKAFPWIRGINFDLPHVVSNNLPCDHVEHIGGNMFNDVPQADVVFLKWILHDWGDDECIQILTKCKEAIPMDKGKLIIVDSIIEEETADKLDDAILSMDMAMLAHTTNGKERTLKEWNHVLMEAGFTHFTVKHIQTIQSIIEAYP